MERSELEYLIKGYADNTLSATERVRFLTEVIQPANAAAYQEVAERLLAEPAEAVVFEERWWSLFERVLRTDAVASQLIPDMVVAPVHRVHFLKSTWFRYAALLLLIAGTATFLYTTYNQPQKEITHHQPLQSPDIPPGGNKAILTLADGSTIVLDSAANGALAQQGNTKIIKLDAGSLAYEPGAATGAPQFNTIRTPNGGQYQITLPDGTKVWLNAASSITFPVTFVKNRTVTIQGEVYLEVASQANQPFIVNTGATTVQVLGTYFNINAYSDEPFQRITLVGGSIQVKQHNQTVLLLPGQQTAVRADEKLNVTAAHVANVLAWKNGLFNFEGLGVQELMRQVARWYNVEVVYQGTIPDDEFLGKMERNSSLADLLTRLKKVGINTRLEDGRKVIVLPSE